MTVWTIILAILFLSLLVAVHELGHYLMGRIFKFTIIEFAIGMGPKLISKKSKKTGISYSLRALPIGGMCQFGEDDEDDKSSADPHHFNNNVWWKRALVLVAGVLMNFILALVLAVVLLTAYGQNDGSRIVAATVEAGSPADMAGMQAGDELLSINSIDINGDTGLDNALQQKKGEASVTVLRDEKEVRLELDNLFNEEHGKNFMGIGIGYKHIDYGFFEAVAAAPGYCVDMVKSVYQGIWMLITGEAPLSEASGPAGVVMLISEFIPEGFEIILILLVLLSVNLGVVNILPLPALDGGRLLLVLIEGITKKRLPRKVEAIIHFIGFALLMILIVVLTYNDIANCIGR